MVSVNWGFGTSALVPQANFPIRLSSDKGDMHVPMSNSESWWSHWLRHARTEWLNKLQLTDYTAHVQHLGSPEVLFTSNALILLPPCSIWGLKTPTSLILMSLRSTWGLKTSKLLMLLFLCSIWGLKTPLCWCCFPCAEFEVPLPSIYWFCAVPVQHWMAQKS